MSITLTNKNAEAPMALDTLSLLFPIIKERKQNSTAIPDDTLSLLFPLRCAA